MTVNQFTKKLQEFLSSGNSTENLFQLIELWIELQPGMVSFGGRICLSNGEEIPINLNKIGKAKCSDFSESIVSFHRLTTNEGHSKWNKALFKTSNNLSIESKFIWDEDLERINRQAYVSDIEHTRQKWYWEEE
jgi:hypothetical protein